MKASKSLARVAGILILGVFAMNVYIGLYDTNLKGVPLHWQLNWVLAALNLVAAILLLAKPRNSIVVTLAGIIWPVAYVGSLAFDVFTRLCAGVSADSCMPDKTSAFQYLILNNPNAPGLGWVLWPYTVPLALAFLAIAWILSIIALISIRRSRVVKRTTTGTPGTVTTPGSSTTAKP